MVDGIRQNEWAHTSSILCMIANVNRDPKRKPTPFEPKDFNPFAGARKSNPLPISDITILKKLLPTGRKR